MSARRPKQQALSLGRSSPRPWDEGMLPRPLCLHYTGGVFGSNRPASKGARRTIPPKQRRVRHRDDVVSVLSRTVREVESAAQRGRVTPAVRTKFQAVALLLRDERARVQAAPGTAVAGLSSSSA